MQPHTIRVPLALLATVLFAGAAACPAGWAQPAAPQDDTPLSERIADYDIDVTLDPEHRILEGVETITWRNTTSQPASELRFHLYYNAWRNDRSSFFSGYRYRDFQFDEYDDDDWAYCDVRSLRLPGDEGRDPADLTPRLFFDQPNDGNEDDRTVLVAPLDQPVGPGETIRVRIEWTSKVPRTFARTGVIDDSYFLAQWFPKIGVFEEEGWNCHQFTGTEFFADFGNYDVRITVPEDWIVGATGRRWKLDKKEGVATHHFRQHDVHDFAWTTSPDYLVFEEKWSADGLPEVQMRLLLRPDRRGKKQRYFDATATALKHFGTWFGPYPYGHVTIVDPPFQSGAGGMEYPTFFTGRTRWLSPRASFSPEGVTIHEAGHQWWYGIVANNEFEHAWLDEGINTYSERRVRSVAYPEPRRLTRRFFDGVIPVAYRDVPITFRLDGADRYRGFESVLKRDSMATDSWRLGPGSYGRLSYDKPALMLRTLENFLGWETMQQILSTYFRRYQFRHPEPQDFFDVVNEVSAQDLSWFFDQVYHGSELFDYGVDSVKSRRTDKIRGYVESEGGELTLVGKREREEGPAFDSVVIVRRWGGATFPVKVRVTFEDGSTETANWDGTDRWKRFDYESRPRVVRVDVDPDRVLVLDVDSTNNSWMREPPSRRAAVKWAARWAFWLQNFLEQLAFLS